MENEVTFKHPPVVETVLSIQFERLRGLTNAHLGAFWQHWKSDWPHVADATPLHEQIESFGKELAWSRAIHLEFTQTPPSRLQIKNASGDRMIQLQNCRLDYNWIGQPAKEYPRYSTVRPEFDTIFDKFQAFIANHDLGKLVPNQWEVTYVNHIPKGTVWNEPHEWPSVFKSLPIAVPAPPETTFEGFGGHWHFEIVPQRGRLHVELQNAYVGEEKKEALVMKLTARGPIEKGMDAKSGMDSGLNLGHDVIVTSFKKLTSERSHAYWNREVSNAD